MLNPLAGLAPSRIRTAVTLCLLALLVVTLRGGASAQAKAAAQKPEGLTASEDTLVGSPVVHVHNLRAGRVVSETSEQFGIAHLPHLPRHLLQDSGGGRLAPVFGMPPFKPPGRRAPVGERRLPDALRCVYLCLRFGP